jgi:hypothetical protein
MIFEPIAFWGKGRLNGGVETFCKVTETPKLDFEASVKLQRPQMKILGLL